MATAEACTPVHRHTFSAAQRGVIIVSFTSPSLTFADRKWSVNKKLCVGFKEWVPEVSPEKIHNVVMLCLYLYLYIFESFLGDLCFCNKYCCWCKQMQLKNRLSCWYLSRKPVFTKPATHQRAFLPSPINSLLASHSPWSESLFTIGNAILKCFIKPDQSKQLVIIPVSSLLAERGSFFDFHPQGIC